MCAGSQPSTARPSASPTAPHSRQPRKRSRSTPRVHSLDGRGTGSAGSDGAALDCSPCPICLVAPSPADTLPPGVPGGTDGVPRAHLLILEFGPSDCPPQSGRAQHHLTHGERFQVLPSADAWLDPFADVSIPVVNNPLLASHGRHTLDRLRRSGRGELANLPPGHPLPSPASGRPQSTALALDHPPIIGDRRLVGRLVRTDRSGCELENGTHPRVILVR